MLHKRALLAAVACFLAWSADRYTVTGIVLQIDRAHRTFSASCAAVPGYMEAMTMIYQVRDPNELAGLQPGAPVEFTLVVSKNSSYAERIRPHRFESMEREPLLTRRLQLLEPHPATLQPGQTISDFTLIDQTGQPVRFSQFTGKVVALTFIYTACPLPNYCFRLSNHFAQLKKRFAARMGRDLVLLSITFDPVHDRPPVLARYAAIWKADPRSWHFLTGSLADVKTVCQKLGVNFWQDEDLLAHPLHTMVIDRRQRLATDLEGNEFSAEQLGDFISVLLETPASTP
jgi:protein SCO1/2